LRPIWCLAALAAVAAAASTADAPGAVRADPSPPPHITVIGDSVLTAVLWYPQPLQILTSGLDVDMEVAICRRLTGVSCPFEGQTPPTLVDLAATRGSGLGKTVVVEAGYNEPEADFGGAVEQSLAALRSAGVTRVLWVSLSERRADYARMNVTLDSAARRHPELTIVDWAAMTHGNNNWFQSDGIHLTYQGGVAMARWLRTSIDQALSADAASDPRPSNVSVVAATLPAARVGRWYSAQLRAQGGWMLPYRWSSAGPLPQGLHLTPGGQVYGVVKKPVDERLTFRVQTGGGTTASRSLRLVAGP